MENIITKWVLNTVKHTGIKFICFSGGVGMNAKAMGKLLENEKIKNLWVPGAGQDDSTCIGAAIEVQKKIKNRKNNFVDLKNLYFGNDANNDEKIFLKNKINKKKYEIIKYSNKKAALFLSKGKILGRVVDRMEFGPRSLGNRSILADPRNLTTKTKINAKIKITGEISIGPKFGRNLLIKFSGGAVNLYETSRIEYTNLLLVFSTLKAMSQLIAALIISTQI